MDKNFARVLAAKNAMTSAVLTASVRMNDGSLRKKNTDRIADLLAEVEKADDPIASELFG